MEDYSQGSESLKRSESQRSESKPLVPKLRFRADIEGLRAIAILLVVAYHAHIPGFSGGYIGVDVFFVISGYLITWLLIHEVESTGRVNLVQFYARRARRLLPALALMLVITAGVSSLLYAPLEQLAIAKTALSTATYRSNLYFAGAAVDYSGADIQTNPLLHTWSLSVEEQFYLIWPLFVLLVSGALLTSKKILSYRRVTLWLTLVSLVSFVLSLHLIQESQPSAFFLTHARAWEFCIGALGLLIPLANSHKLVREFLGWLGLTGILLTAVFFSDATPFPGWAALLPAFSTVLVLRACSHLSVTPKIVSFLSVDLFQKIGKISYSWYLWHWPVLVFANTLSNQVPLLIRIVLLLFSIIPAVASYHWVENPIRRSVFLGKRPIYSISIAFFLAIFGSWFSLGWDQQAGRWSYQPEQRFYTLVKDDNAWVYGTPCNGDRSTEVPNIEACTTPGVEGGLKVVLFGDSHAAQWSDAISAISREKGWQFTSMTKSGCTYVDNVTYLPQIGAYTTCTTWRKNVIDYVQRTQPDLVIVSTLSNPKVYPFSPTEWFEGTDRTVSAMSAASGKVVILRDPPDPGFDVPNCLSRNQWRPYAVLKNECNIVGDKAPGEIAYREQQKAADRYRNVFAIDMAPYICGEEKCELRRGDTVVYRDDNHLSVEFTLTLLPTLDEQLNTVLSGQS